MLRFMTETPRGVNKYFPNQPFFSHSPFASVSSPLLPPPPYCGRMRILIVLAHPRASVSVAQRALAVAARSVPGVTVHDLYAAYPDFNIDAEKEQALLLANDL